MKITGGQARGILLKAPKGDKTRPATDYLRESIFSSLSHAIADARVLDLFAGTGAYGLEALSRGAQAVTFVEKDRHALRCIQLNLSATLKSLQKESTATRHAVIAQDVFRLNLSATTFDFIFIDPPYELLEQKGSAILELAAPHLANQDHARIILEAPGAFECEPPENLKLIKKTEKGRHQPSLLIFAR